MKRLNIKKIIYNAKNEYKKAYGNKLIKVFLYGSYARNDEDNESDIDIVGIVKGKKNDIQKRLSNIRKSMYKFDLTNDTITSAMAIQYEEYEKYKNIIPYYINIEKEGQVIG